MKKWQYESAADLDQTMIERLRNFPREPDMLVYGLRSLVALIIRALLRTYCRFEIVGEEHIPTDMRREWWSNADLIKSKSGGPLQVWPPIRQGAGQKQMKIIDFCGDDADV